MRKKIAVFLFTIVLAFTFIGCSLLPTPTPGEDDQYAIADDSNIIVTYSAELLTRLATLTKTDAATVNTELVPILKHAKMTEAKVAAILDYIDAQKDKIIGMSEEYLEFDEPGDIENVDVKAVRTLFKGARAVLSSDDAGKLLYSIMVNNTRDIPGYSYTPTFNFEEFMSGISILQSFVNDGIAINYDDRSNYTSESYTEFLTASDSLTVLIKTYLDAVSAYAKGILSNWYSLNYLNELSYWSLIYTLRYEIWSGEEKYNELSDLYYAGMESLFEQVDALSKILKAKPVATVAEVKGLAEKIGRDNFILLSRFVFRISDKAIDRDAETAFKFVYSTEMPSQKELYEITLSEIEAVDEIYSAFTDRDFDILIDVALALGAFGADKNGVNVPEAKINQVKTQLKEIMPKYRVIIRLVLNGAKTMTQAQFDKTLKILLKDGIGHSIYITEHDASELLEMATSAFIAGYDKLSAAEKNTANSLLTAFCKDAQYMNGIDKEDYKLFDAKLWATDFMAAVRLFNSGLSKVWPTTAEQEVLDLFFEHYDNFFKAMGHYFISIWSDMGLPV